MLCNPQHNRSFIRITFFYPIRWNGKVIFLLIDRSHAIANGQTKHAFLNSAVSFLLLLISFDTLILSVYFSSSSYPFFIYFLLKISKQIPEVIKHFMFNCDNNNDKLYSSCYYLIFVQQMQNAISKWKTKNKTRERERANKKYLYDKNGKFKRGNKWFTMFLLLAGSCLLWAMSSASMQHGQV